MQMFYNICKHDIGGCRKTNHNYSHYSYLYIYVLLDSEYEYPNGRWRLREVVTQTCILFSDKGLSEVLSFEVLVYACVCSWTCAYLSTVYGTDGKSDGWKRMTRYMSAAYRSLKQQEPSDGEWLAHNTPPTNTAQTTTINNTIISQ